MVGFEPTSDPSLKDRSIQLSYIGSPQMIEVSGVTNSINIKSVDTYLPTLYITSLPNSLKPSDLYSLNAGLFSTPTYNITLFNP